MRTKFVVSVVIVFVVLTALFFAMRTYAPAFHFNVLMGGNIIMALLSLCSYLIVTRQLHERPAAFVRGVSAASFLKLMICMVGILVYVLLNRASIHKPSVFVLFGIYALYTSIETISLSKLARVERKL
jgi:hypothetical protein